MAGIPVSSVKNFPSIEEHFDLAFVSTGTVAGFTTLPQSANGYTDLGVCLPEEAVIVGAWIAPEPGIALPASTAGLALVVAGGWVTSVGNEPITYQAVTAPTGAITDALRASETVSLLAADGWAAGQLKAIPIHKSSGTNTATGGRLNNNVVPPGGRIYLHNTSDPSGLTFRGRLVVRVQTNRR